MKTDGSLREGEARAAQRAKGRWELQVPQVALQVGRVRRLEPGVGGGWVWGQEPLLAFGATFATDPLGTSHHGWGSGGST